MKKEKTSISEGRVVDINYPPKDLPEGWLEAVTEDVMTSQERNQFASELDKLDTEKWEKIKNRTNKYD